MSIEAGDPVRIAIDGEPTLRGWATEREGDTAWLVETHELGLIVVPERDLARDAGAIHVMPADGSNGFVVEFVDD